MAQFPNEKLILASASPRRRDLLEEIQIDFEIIPAHIWEGRLDGEACEKLAMRLACEKATEIAKRHTNRWVLGADTIVTLPGNPERILGKPESDDDAVSMLLDLSGKEHWVQTGVALVKWSGETGEAKTIVWVEKSRVVFRDLTESEIREYVQTGEPMDKAGAYAIQGGAAAFVDHYEGSWTNIVGLPMESLSERLQEIGLLESR